MSKPEQTTSDDLDEQAVANYLTEHPDFFQRHSQLVSDLKIPHGERGSVSLVERQLEVQRERYRHLQIQLQQLIDNADANQSVYDRIGTLAIALAKTDSLEGLLQSLCDQLADNFAVDAVAIELPERADQQWPDLVRTMKEPADTTIKSETFDTPYLGAPPQGLPLYELFGDRADEVTSVAILSLSGPEKGGRLLLASFDSERFRADLGTELLTQIADLFAALLGNHWAAGQ